MEKIEIYSSKKKSFLLLIGSLVFVIGGIYMFINPENFMSYKIRNINVIRGAGVSSILFFGLGIYVSIRQLIKKQLILIIDKTGVNINPKKSLEENIGWKFIDGFSEIKIRFPTKFSSATIIIININNPEYWIEKESNVIRKKMMQFNTKLYNSPFNLSANSMEINHIELMKILNDSLNKYKYLKS